MPKRARKAKCVTARATAANARSTGLVPQVVMTPVPSIVPEASMAAQIPESQTPGEAPKMIPLQCSVCPDSPTFSDVSHLLTHIASKGHLHHETQTKLKAHQDHEASITLLNYEKWYQNNGIETLLVDRMKAKQDKDATRRRRTGGSSAPPLPKQLNRKPKRPSNNTTEIIKTEDEGLHANLDMVPYLNLPLADNDMDEVEVVSRFGDPMSLKGLVWPGMGKLDLANDEMKRIRNQRKPRSVIEKMRRTSEGISSEQVVYNSGFEFERTKDVYDELTPDEDGREPVLAIKSGRPKRKKTVALADVPVNIPRRNLKQARGENCEQTDTLKPTTDSGRNINHELSISVPSSHRPTPDIFSDEELKPAFDEQGFAVPSTRERSFDFRERYNVQDLNILAHSNLASPNPIQRDLTPGLSESGNYGHRQRFSAAS